MTELAATSFCVALSVYLILLKWNIRRVCGYLHWIEAGLLKVVVLPILFVGTYHGILIGTFAGLWLSFMLSLTKWLNGYERYCHKDQCWYFYSE